MAQSTGTAPTFRIGTFERRHLTYGDGYVATVEANGNILHVSRYDDEDEWTVDGLWRSANSFPVFHNGAGSRCTRRTVIVEPDIFAALNARAQSERVAR